LKNIKIKELMGNIELVDSKYGKIYIVTSDIISSEIKKGNYFEEELILNLLPYITEGSNVLDIGANIGTYTLPFAKKNCTVHAFEPQKFVFKLLEKTVKENNLENVVLYNNAVGHKNMKTSMNLFEVGDITKPVVYSPMHTKNMGGLQIGLGGESVNMITIDELNLTNVSVMKVDVEGFEPMVFLGAKETIKRERPVILFEWHGYIVNKNMIKSTDITEKCDPFNLLEEYNYQWKIEIPYKGVLNYLYLPCFNYYGDDE
jgi:FkbM family methyltransferase